MTTAAKKRAVDRVHTLAAVVQFNAAELADFATIDPDLLADLLIQTRNLAAAVQELHNEVRGNPQPKPAV